MTRKNLRLLMLSLCVAAPLTGNAACKSSMIEGHYGFTTKATSTTGVISTGLSRVDFMSNGKVSENYFVNTTTTSYEASSLGTYSVTSDCKFSMNVLDSTGEPYGLTGRVNPMTREIVVLETNSGSADVSTAVMYPVGLDFCTDQRFSGRYAFLSQGIVPASNGSSQRVPESRIGWFTADQDNLNQPVQLINLNGVVTESTPEVIPKTTLDSCLVNISNSQFVGVIVEKGARVLYMDRSPGSNRTGVMLKVR
jgi:hypothetical protein